MKSNPLTKTINRSNFGATILFWRNWDEKGLEVHGFGKSVHNYNAEQNAMNANLSLFFEKAFFECTLVKW